MLAKNKKPLNPAQTRALVVKTIVWVLFAIFFLWTVFPIFWMISSALKVEVEMFTIPPAWLFKPSLRNFKGLEEAFGI